MVRRRFQRFTLRQAAEWLLDHAVREPVTVETRAGKVDLKPGELLTSMTVLADAWKMSRRWAWKTLGTLTLEGFCETVAETHGTRIILLNFNDMAQPLVRAVNGRVNAPAISPNPRESVGSVPGMIAWCKEAQPGASVTYHIGNLALDRTQSPALNELADMVMILTGREYLRVEQVRANFAALSGYYYLAIKTGRGGVVPSIMDQRISPTHYRALMALAHLHAVKSAQRCLRMSLLSDVQLQTRPVADGCVSKLASSVHTRDLRQTSASLLVHGGAPLQLADRLLGHTVIGTTQRDPT